VDISLNCIGVLETEKIKAEKSIEEVNKSSLLNAIEINAFTSIHLAQVLKSFIKNSESPVFATLSAKVGSIEDNRLGGWYSYRISKVALNMALKNISIEFKRLNKNFNAFAIHPGTTETQITKKYLKSARKKYQIHSPDETAENIYNCILEAQSQAYNGRFLSWNGDILPW
jgi:NAD(P)-dependent dehydrogenase (short-subunit alcohol dehydrogenase family)